jgi:hypothetical protein
MYPQSPSNEYERDFKLAMQLIWGVEEWDENGVPHHSFLPRSSEREAYKALCRLLFLPEVHRVLPAFHQEILGCLAALFDPDDDSYPLKAVVKRRHRRPPRNEFRAFHIAEFVDRLRRKGKSYDDATLAVAKALGKSHEHIKKLYGGDRGPSAK